MIADTPSNTIVMDTDVFSWVTWRRPDDRPLFEGFAPLVDYRPWALSFATVAELKSGTLHTHHRWGLRKLKILEDEIHKCTLLTATETVINAFAQIHAKFRHQIGDNDMWIAACALAHNPVLPIATGNLRHFQPISDVFGIPLVHPDLN